MSEDPEISDVERRYQELKRLREEEETKYNELLTLLDQRSPFPLPREQSVRMEEIKSALNQLWDVSADAFSIAEQEKRFFWRDVARNTTEYLQPFVKRQKEFNGAIVHLLNDFLASVNEAFAQIRLFHHTMILYCQQFTPVTDSKFREAIGKSESTLSFFSERVRDHIDLLYQELDRKMEALETASATPSSAGPNVAPQMPGATYFHFEQDFRGTRESIKQRLADYVHYFEDRKSNAPVLDLGCGRGEFLELLRDAKISAFGVDSNARMVEHCRQMGLEAWHEDLLKFLESEKDRSLAGLFCSQVVEHLPSSNLLAMLQSAHKRLEEGATIILETVNVSSAFSFLQVFLRDLTHVTPCHPETLKFLVDACGFQNSKIVMRTPVEPEKLLRLIAETPEDSNQLLNENIRKLNALLFDFQEYAVVATK
jgi:O-antigen chain-terminating methyltransferase